MATREQLDAKRRSIATQIRSTKDPKKVAALNKQLSSIRAQMGTSTSSKSNGLNVNDPNAVLKSASDLYGHMADKAFNVNNPNQESPLGSQTFVTNPDGTHTKKITFAPEEAKTLAAQQAHSQGLLALGKNFADQAGAANTTPFNYDNAPGVTKYDMSGAPQMRGLSNEGLPALNEFNINGAPNVQGPNFQNLPGLLAVSSDGVTQPGFSADRQRYEDAMYSGATKRLDPLYARDEQNFAQSLADRGLPPGSTNYEEQMANFRTAKSDAYQDAHWKATAAGGQEQQRMNEMLLAARTQMADEEKYGSDFSLRDRDRYLREQQGIYDNELSRRGQFFDENRDMSNNSIAARGQYDNEQQAGQDNSLALRNQWGTERQAERNFPLNQANSIMQSYQGMNAPTFTAGQPYNEQAPDVGGIASNYAGQNATADLQKKQQMFEAKESAKARQSQWALANLGRGGGGGGGGGGRGRGGYQPSAMQQYPATQGGSGPLQQQGGGFDLGSGLLAAGGNAVAQGAGKGIGNWLGNWFTNLFGGAAKAA